MKEGSLLTFTEFCQKLCADGKAFLQNPQLRRQNYEIRIREERDAYDTPEDMVYLYNHAKPELQVPSYSVEMSYETYCRSRDAEKVICILVGLMERQYPDVEQPEKTVKQEKNPQSQPEVVTLEGNQEQEVSELFVVMSGSENQRRGAPYDDNQLGALAEKVQGNLQLLPLTAEGTMLVVPVQTAGEYDENLSFLKELRMMEKQSEQELSAALYDKDRNLVLQNPEEIKELLLSGKTWRKSIFSRM